MCNCDTFLSAIQRTYTGIQASRLSAEIWGVGLVTKLLEVMHGQWLYCNIQIQVHDKISGTLVTLRFLSARAPSSNILFGPDRYVSSTNTHTPPATSNGG